MSVFSTLNAINVNDHVEKKNGLSYLSWAWAWAEVKKLYPDAQVNVIHSKDGLNYFTDGMTAWVEVGVTIEGFEMVESLPVMDYRNKSITLDKLTSFDVNTAIKRCMTKAIAMHGLGLYIYAGEDLPEDQAEPKDRTLDIKTIIALALKKGQQDKINENGVLLKNGRIKSFNELTSDEWSDLKKKLSEMPNA